MNQKGFANILLIVLVVVLVGALGYITLVKKPVPADNTVSQNQPATQPPVTPTSSLPTTCVDQPGTKAVITSLSTYSGPVGTTLEIKGCNFAGFEGDKNAWIENSQGVKGFLVGDQGSTAKLIKVTLKSPLCSQNNSYSGLPCSSYLTLAPGTYKIWTMPWGADTKSNPATFTIQTANQATPVAQTSNPKISDWKTYAKDGFQMRYPSQYEVRKDKVAGSYATISFQTNDANRVLGINVTSGDCKDFGSNIKTSQVTINGTSFIKGDISNDFNGMETRASAVEYCAMRNGKAYKIIPRIFFRNGEEVLDVDKDSIFNEMISSFKITPTITTASSITGQNFVVVGGETAHIWGANLVNNGTITTTVFIGDTKTSALPPSEMSNDNGFNFVVPSSLVAGQSYNLYVTNNIGTSNVVRVKVLASSPTSTTPTVSYVNPPSVKVGDKITVYGSNLYGTIFSLDNLWGTTDNSIYQDPSGTSFSFIVPTELNSVGIHSIQVYGASNAITFTVSSK